MKKLFLFVVLFTWIGFSASAQDQKDSTKKEMWKESKEMHKDSKMKMHQKKHYWVFRDGKVMEIKDGKEHHMITETEVSDGIWIRPNGEVVMKDNKVVHLKSNQYLDKMGKIHMMSEHKSKKK